MLLLLYQCLKKVLYKRNCKNHNSEDHTKSSWKLASAKDCKWVPGLPKAKENFLDDFVGPSPKPSTADFLLRLFCNWGSGVWLLLLYNWQLDGTNKYPEHSRPEFDVSLCLWIFKHAFPIFLKIVPAASSLDSNGLQRQYILCTAWPS